MGLRDMKEEIINIKFSSASDLFDIMNRILEREIKITGRADHLWVISLGGDSKICNVELINRADRELSEIKTAEIYQLAIQKSAQAVIIVRNRKNFLIEEEEADRIFCCRMYKAGEVVEVKLLDYIIFSPEDFNSFRDRDLIREILNSEECRELSNAADIFVPEGEQNNSISVIIAQRMLTSGESPEKIAIYTGLDIDLIKQLSESSDLSEED